MNPIDIEQQYTKYGGMVYRRCLKILQNDQQAMDAMQDVFIQLMRHQARIEDQGMSSLLYRMATNISLNMIRHQKVRDDHVDAELALPQMAEADDRPLEEMMVIENQLLTTLSKFAPKVQEAAIYHYVDGFTMDEVAQMLEMSNSNVRRLLRELRQTSQLQEAML